MLQSPSIWMTILAFVLLLGPLVVVHEFGHYLVGRLFGVKVDAFSVGFGRELFGWTDRHGTRWKLSALPLGGYVQFAGDWNAVGMPDEELNDLSPHDREQTFHGKPLWQRALIVAAGPVTNLLFAMAIFTAFNLAYGKIEASPVIAELAPNSPAAAAGLRAGDRISAIDGSPIESFTDIPEHVVAFPGKTVRIAALRQGEPVVVSVRIAEHMERDKFGHEARIGRLGIKGGKGEIVRMGPVDAMALSGRQCMGIVRMMVTGISQIIVGDRSAKELGGPISIARMSGEQLSLGWPEFVWFAALISINLAFINLLPIPALDGGHLAFYAAEAVRRKPLGLRSQEWAFRTGLALVLALMLFVTINDIASLRLFGG